MEGCHRGVVWQESYAKSLKPRGNFYKVAIRPTMLYGSVGRQGKPNGHVGWSWELREGRLGKEGGKHDC